MISEWLIKHNTGQVIQMAIFVMYYQIKRGSLRHPMTQPVSKCYPSCNRCTFFWLAQISYFISDVTQLDIMITLKKVGGSKAEAAIIPFSNVFMTTLATKLDEKWRNWMFYSQFSS